VSQLLGEFFSSQQVPGILQRLGPFGTTSREPGNFFGGQGNYGGSSYGTGVPSAPGVSSVYNPYGDVTSQRQA
jgi:hypothetical protein